MGQNFVDILPVVFIQERKKDYSSYMYCGSDGA